VSPKLLKAESDYRYVTIYWEDEATINSGFGLVNIAVGFT